MQSSGTPVFVPYLIFGKSTSSFSIILEQPAPTDIYFDWIALASKSVVGDVAGVSETAILGCINPTAINYNNLATQDDGSCSFDQIIPIIESETTSSTNSTPQDEGVGFLTPESTTTTETHIPTEIQELQTEPEEPITSVNSSEENHVTP
jgi:hypothetical protein